MKDLFNDIISFDTKYKHIPLSIFVIVYCFSPIDILPEGIFNTWWCYLDDIVILLTTCLSVYMDKGNVLKLHMEFQNITQVKKINECTEPVITEPEFKQELQEPQTQSISTSDIDIANIIQNIERIEETQPTNPTTFVKELKQVNRPETLMVEPGTILW